MDVKGQMPAAVEHNNFHLDHCFHTDHCVMRNIIICCLVLAAPAIRLFSDLNAPSITQPAPSPVQPVLTSDPAEVNAVKGDNPTCCHNSNQPADSQLSNTKTASCCQQSTASSACQNCERAPNNCCTQPEESQPEESKPGEQQVEGHDISPAQGRILTSLSTTRLKKHTGIRVSDGFPDIVLTDQDGIQHRFLTDLVRDHVVCIVLFYTKCDGSCPGTTLLMQRLRKEMSSQFAEDELRFISISLDSETDTPDVLKAYADERQLGPAPGLANWYFCTGEHQDVETLRFALGLYDPDPIIDADRNEHAALLTFGNDQYNRWVAMPAGIGFDDLSETFLRITGYSERQRFGLRMIDQRGQATSPVSRDDQPLDCCSKTIAADKPDCCSTEGQCCCSAKPQTP